MLLGWTVRTVRHQARLLATGTGAHGPSHVSLRLRRSWSPGRARDQQRQWLRLAIRFECAARRNPALSGLRGTSQELWSPTGPLHRSGYYLSSSRSTLSRHRDSRGPNRMLSHKLDRFGKVSEVIQYLAHCEPDSNSFGRSRAAISRTSIPRAHFPRQSSSSARVDGRIELFWLKLDAPQEQAALRDIRPNEVRQNPPRSWLRPNRARHLGRH